MYWPYSETSYPFFNVITELGDKIGIGIIAFMMCLWLGYKKRDYMAIVILLLAVAVGNEMSKVLKDFIGRERPVTAEFAETLSFPSGHAMIGFILYFITAYFLIRHFHSVKLKWGTGIIAFILVLLIGLSRIVLRTLPNRCSWTICNWYDVVHFMDASLLWLKHFYKGSTGEEKYKVIPVKSITKQLTGFPSQLFSLFTLSSKILYLVTNDGRG